MSDMVALALAMASAEKMRPLSRISARAVPLINAINGKANSKGRKLRIRTSRASCYGPWHYSQSQRQRKGQLERQPPTEQGQTHSYDTSMPKGRSIMARI